MNENSQPGQPETPVNMLEPIEADFMAGKPFDPSLSGQAETPVHLLDPIEGTAQFDQKATELKAS
jgi:hypothetical protein